MGTSSVTSLEALLGKQGGLSKRLVKESLQEVRFIQSGGPVQHTYIGSVSSRGRDECLPQQHWFASLSQMRTMLDSWRLLAVDTAQPNPSTTILPTHSRFECY